MRVLIVALAAMVTTATAAKSKDSRHIACEIHTIVEGNDISRVTGTDTWILHYENGRLEQLTLPMACIPEETETNVTDAKVVVSCFAAIGATRVWNEFIIDRTSGEYFKVF